jgi:hypothetical protein
VDGYSSNRQRLMVGNPGVLLAVVLLFGAIPSRRTDLLANTSRSLAKQLETTSKTRNARFLTMRCL